MPNLDILEYGCILFLILKEKAQPSKSIQIKAILKETGVVQRRGHVTVP